MSRIPKNVKALRKMSQILLGADEWDPPVPIMETDENGEEYVGGWIVDRKKVRGWE